jgi:hypothetical protein
MPEPSDEAVELDDEGKPLVGVKAKQAAVDFLKGILEVVSCFCRICGFWSLELDFVSEINF